MNKKFNSLLIIRKSSAELDWILPVLDEMKDKVNFFTLFLNKESFDSVRRNEFLFKKWNRISKNFYVQKKSDRFFYKSLRVLFNYFKLFKRKNFFINFQNYLDQKIHNLNDLKSNLKINNKDNFHFVLNEFQKISYWCEEISKKNRKSKIFLFPHTTHIYDPKFIKKFKLSDKRKIKYCDGLFLGNYIDKEIWKNKIQPNKIYITGHPKYDFNWQKKFNKRKNKLKTKIVFVLKNIIDLTSYTNTELYLNEIYRICLKFDYILEIKLPPFQQPQLIEIIEKFKKNKVKNNLIISDQNIFYSIKKSQLLINFNLSATTLDAISLNVPVIQLPVINKIKGRYKSTKSIYTKLKMARSVKSINKLEKNILLIMNKRNIKDDLKKNFYKYFPKKINSAKNIKEIILSKI